MMLRTPDRSRVRPSATAVPCCRGAALVMAVAAVIFSSTACADDELGVRVPDGFEVSLYADNSLASDIFSMTIDSLGRVVVSGPGYVRILIDADGDGRAESFKQFADGPATGAQGMFFHGRDLVCTGDAGLIRFRDENGDDRADGPAEVFLKIRAGGEHDAHAIRRGPDGWWYLMSGNMAGVDEKFIALATSPVKHPRQGTVMRFRPDLSAGEVLAHGYRNAYDFDFNADGDLLTFDSDGEREISLPAYQPTRVFHAAPGSHAGWMSDHWKRPGDFLDMPPVLAEFGRGSPTGVACYRHTQFPEQYRGALFVLDWTFGRIFALPAERSGSAPISKEPIPFLTTVGENGFAPTDIEVGPDGSLFVSVGGRGTRGGIYRIQARGESAAPAPLPSEKLATCLDAPQPLASWSRAKWEPIAEVLGPGPFLKTAADEREPVTRRVRAIEIVTERFKGLDTSTATRLATSPRPEIRARLAWSLGRTRPEDPNVPLLQTLLRDANPFVQRSALEAALCSDSATLDELAESLGATLGSSDRFVRMAGVRVLARMSRGGYAKAAAAAITRGPRAGIALAVAYSHRHPGYEAYSVDIARRVLESNVPAEVKLDAARLMQIGLGDVGATGEDLPQAFEGYTSRVDLSLHAADLEPAFSAVSKCFPSGNATLDRELGRVIAMLQPGDSDILARVGKQINAESSPVDDVHWLLVAGRINAPRTPETTAALARGLLQLEAKIKARSLLIDSHWEEQINEIYAALVERDEALPQAILADASFGRPAHIPFVSALPIESLDDAIAAFVKQAKSDPEYPWSGDVIYLLSRSEQPEIQALIRSKFDDYSLRNSVLLSISETPVDSDRALFVAGLENTPLDILAVCTQSLILLKPYDGADEQVALIRALRRLGDRGQEREVRDQIVERLQVNNNARFDYVLGKDGLNQQAAIENWVAYIREKFPTVFAVLSGESKEDAGHLAGLLAEADWSAGDAARGRKLFETRSCIQCHSGRGAVGPDLNGAAQRFSRDDLFTAIADPSRDVSPRYQTTAISTTDGKMLSGLIMYESVDYLVLRNASNQTSRIEKKNIEEQRTMSQSLMPTGLLKDLTAGDLADLYAYMRGMGVPATAAGPMDAVK